MHARDETCEEGGAKETINKRRLSGHDQQKETLRTRSTKGGAKDTINKKRRKGDDQQKLKGLGISGKHNKASALRAFVLR